MEFMNLKYLLDFMDIKAATIDFCRKYLNSGSHVTCQRPATAAATADYSSKFRLASLLVSPNSLTFMNFMVFMDFENPGHFIKLMHLCGLLRQIRTFVL